MRASIIYQGLKEAGFNFYTGVPCSWLAPLIDILSKNETYIPAVNESVAVGIATGAVLAGKKACVLMQNSGLACCIGTLASLNLTYKIPILLIISLRKGEPEHTIMGKKTLGLLTLFGDEWPLLKEAVVIEEALEA